MCLSGFSGSVLLGSRPNDEVNMSDAPFFHSQCVCVCVCVRQVAKWH